MAKRDKLVFGCFFPKFENIHLAKDVGMIPFVLHRDFGYESYVISYRNEEYRDLNRETPGLKIIFIKADKKIFHEIIKLRKISNSKLLELLKTISVLLDSTPLLLKIGKNFDVLQVYHWTLESVLIGIIYRLINKRGILYLKLDMDPNIINSYKNDTSFLDIRFYIWSKLFDLAAFDIIGIETKTLYNFLTRKHRLFNRYEDNIFFLPNGVDFFKLKRFRKDFAKKDNTIIHLGRIGTYQKGSEIILESFARITHDFPNWKLILIGSMEREFAEYYNEFVANNMLSQKITYMGFLKSREKLYECYSSAKIVAIPSRFESFGLVGIEGEFFGGIILGSAISAIFEITDNGNLGYLCPVDDTKCFAGNLKYMLNNEQELSMKSQLVSNFIERNYNWKTICEDINRKIEELKNSMPE